MQSLILAATAPLLVEERLLLLLVMLPTQGGNLGARRGSALGLGRLLTGNTDFQGRFSSLDCEVEADVGPKYKIQIASFFAQATNWFKLENRQQVG